jgi:phosphoribosyl-ATP pyrophosphohydrolase
MTGLGAEFERLAAVIADRKGVDPTTSYTAALLAAGVARCAKKFGEEAVETVIAAASGDKAALAAEAADAVYHLLVLLEAAGVSPSEVAARLARRAGVSGHAEKAARGRSPDAAK